jgi:SRSO17 transposase
MQVNAQNQSYQQVQISQCPKYVNGLLLCGKRKVCTNLAKSVNESHDTIYREMDELSKTEETKEILYKIALSKLDKENTFLIFDDVKLAKIYAEEIEGLEVGYDGSTGQKLLGLNMVTSLLTDKIHHIPIDATPYGGKELSGLHYKTKSAIAKTIAECIIAQIKIKRILGDAHYATKEFITWLYNLQITYLMKIPRNRVVTIGDQEGRLQDILRLQKNSHSACVQGLFQGVSCYFYVVKIKNGSTVYFISHDQIPLKEVLALYRIRWKIELFHRTGKQSFGMKECQMLAMKKQRQHVLFVMHAYAIAECIRVREKFDNIEDVLKSYRT